MNADGAPDQPSWQTVEFMIDRFGGSPDRKAAAAWAAKQLREFVGEDWVTRWYERNGALPGFLLNAPYHPHAFHDLLKLALSIRANRGVAGLRQVRSDVRGNVEPHRLAHATLQVEIAALASARGMASRFELFRPEVGRPADLTIATDLGERDVECFVIHTDQGTRSDAAHDERLGREFNRISWMHGVFFAGELRERLTDEANAQLLRALEDLARETGIDQAPRTHASEHADIEVLPMHLANGRSFHSPTSIGRGWQRDDAIIRAKARDWAAAKNPVWLRIDVHDGLWAFSNWAQASLAEKGAQMAAMIRDAIDTDNVEGVVLSSGAAFILGIPLGESAFDTGIGMWALRRQVAPFVAREVIVLARRYEADLLARQWVAMYDGEHEWLEMSMLAAGLNPEALAITA